MFSRRVPKPASLKIRDMIWPRMGWRRALKFRARQLMRISGSPHAVAAGAAAGMFAAFSPLFGFHYLIAASLALVMGGSVLASAVVTTLANPVTLPLFWAVSYEVGRFFVSAPQDFSARALIEQHSWSALEPFLEPLMVGSVLVGAVLGVGMYFLVRTIVAHQRSVRLASHKRLP